MEPVTISIFEVTNT